MTDQLNALLMIVLVINLFALGTSRLLALIRIVAFQGALLGIIPLLAHPHLKLPMILMALGAVILKGYAIPAIMLRALREAQIKREVEPLVGYIASIMLGAVGTAGSLLFASHLPLLPEHAGSLLVPAAMATILTGFILLTTRFKAITQIVGYLVLENGIYIFGMLLVEAMPFVVEIGVMLDLFVAVFVICIITNHINAAFSSMDTRRLVSLKD